MDSIEEKRVYAGGDRPAVAYVASSTGLVRANVAEERVGEFSLCVRGDARDVAADGRQIAVATATDVLVGDRADGAATAVAGDSFAETGFGPAVAVGVDDGIVAAGPDGRVARRRGGEWHELEPALGDVRAIDGDLLATDDGVYRVREGRLDRAGLEDVRDVSVPGVPLAATSSALYALGNGWTLVHEGATDVVAADPGSDPGRLDRAHAAAGDTVFEHVDGEWRECGRPGRIVDVGYGEAVYAVTIDGRLLSRADDGWRSHHLGVVEVGGLAIREP